MKTYRIWFLDWNTANYFETGEPLRYRDYTARSATQALRQWMSHYYGYAAERIEVIDKQTENSV